MTAPPPLSSDAILDPAADHAAWAEAVMRRQVLLLEQLAQSGLRLARAIEQDVTEAEEVSDKAKAESALAHARVSRAVRMTALLQTRLIQDIGRLKSWTALTAEQARETAKAQFEAAQALADPAYAHKARVEAIVARVIRAETDNEEKIERLICETGERLDDDDIYGDISTRPVGELVSLICRDLDIRPDWKHLGEEAWAKAEAAAGDPRSPFCASSPARGGGGPEGWRGRTAAPPVFSDSA